MVRARRGRGVRMKRKRKLAIMTCRRQAKVATMTCRRQADLQRKMMLLFRFDRATPDAKAVTTPLRTQKYGLRQVKNLGSLFH